jgi:uncharacterized protein (DUF885 family)
MGAVTDAILPSYRQLLRFMTEEYIPEARLSLAATELPRGQDYYRFLISKYTTLDLTAEEIHELGKKELATIRSRMEELKARVGFSGTLPELFTSLRSDARFYAKTPEQLLERAASIGKRMDGKLPSLFGRLPRQPWSIKPVPAHLAPKYTSGRYAPSPQDSTEPGWYWVNTYALEKRPLYGLTALTLHEAVPGHHLQGALAEEQEGVLPFRRYTYLSVFGEGWGLYAEWLGLEAGMYEDPYHELGFWSYQAWRACRLVIDTGVHAFGWSRERALDLLAQNTALPLHEVETEVDRYISWPGQALSYEIGYLELRKARSKAEAALSERFDVRAFHDAVLEQGSIPMPVLRQRVDQFIEQQRGARSTSGSER